MKMYVWVLIASFGALSLLGCYASTQASKHTNSVNPQQASNNNAAKDLSEEDRQRYYRTFGIVSWKVDNKGTFVEARIETTKVLLNDLPKGLPFSRMVIENLATGTTIYKEDLSYDFPLSMYTRNVNADPYDELVLNMSAGASSNQLRILSVSATQVHELLSVAYRMDAVLIDLGEGRVDLLVTPGFDKPFTTTHYVLKQNRYEPAGEVPYNKLVNEIRNQFNAPRQTRQARRR